MEILTENSNVQKYKKVAKTEDIFLFDTTETQPAFDIILEKMF